MTFAFVSSIVYMICMLFPAKFQNSLKFMESKEDSYVNVIRTFVVPAVINTNWQMKDRFIDF